MIEWEQWESPADDPFDAFLDAEIPEDSDQPILPGLPAGFLAYQRNWTPNRGLPGSLCD